MKVWNLIDAYKAVPNVTLHLRDENGITYYNDDIMEFFLKEPIGLWHKELKRFTVVPLPDGSQTIVARFKE